MTPSFATKSTPPSPTAFSPFMFPIPSITKPPTPRAIQPPRGAKARRPGTDHRHLLARPRRRRFRRHPALVPSLVDDGTLQVLDRHGRRADAQHARTLAWRGADPAREFRKII